MALWELKKDRLGTADLQLLAYWVRSMRIGSRSRNQQFAKTPSPAFLITIEGRLMTCVGWCIRFDAQMHARLDLIKLQSGIILCRKLKATDAAVMLLQRMV